MSASISILPGVENGPAENHAARMEDVLTLQDAVNAEKNQNSPRYSSNVFTNPFTITRILPHWPMEQI